MNIQVDTKKVDEVEKVSNAYVHMAYTEQMDEANLALVREKDEIEELAYPLDTVPYILEFPQSSPI